MFSVEEGTWDFEFWDCHGHLLEQKSNQPIDEFTQDYLSLPDSSLNPASLGVYIHSAPCWGPPAPGSGNAYEYVAILSVDTRYEIVGKDNNGNWAIGGPGEGPFCWVVETNTISITGKTSLVPVLTPPPIPNITTYEDFNTLNPIAIANQDINCVRDPYHQEIIRQFAQGDLARIWLQHFEQDYWYLEGIRYDDPSDEYECWVPKDQVSVIGNPNDVGIANLFEPEVTEYMVFVENKSDQVVSGILAWSDSGKEYRYKSMECDFSAGVSCSDKLIYPNNTGIIFLNAWEERPNWDEFAEPFIGGTHWDPLGEPIEYYAFEFLDEFSFTISWVTLRNPLSQLVDENGEWSMIYYGN